MRILQWQTAAQLEQSKRTLCIAESVENLLPIQTRPNRTDHFFEALNAHHSFIKDTFFPCITGKTVIKFFKLIIIAGECRPGG